MMTLRNRLEKWKLSLVDANATPKRGDGFICIEPNGAGDIYSIELPFCADCKSISMNGVHQSGNLRVLYMLYMAEKDTFCDFVNFDNLGNDAHFFTSKIELETFLALKRCEVPDPKTKNIRNTKGKHKFWKDVFDSFVQVLQKEDTFELTSGDIDLEDSLAMTTILEMMNTAGFTLAEPKHENMAELYDCFQEHANIYQHFNVERIENMFEGETEPIIACALETIKKKEADRYEQTMAGLVQLIHTGSFDFIYERIQNMFVSNKIRMKKKRSVEAYIDSPSNVKPVKRKEQISELSNEKKKERGIVLGKMESRVKILKEKYETEWLKLMPHSSSLDFTQKALTKVQNGEYHSEISLLMARAKKSERVSTNTDVQKQRKNKEKRQDSSAAGTKKKKRDDNGVSIKSKNPWPSL